MRIVSSILLLIGALAVLSLGVSGAFTAPAAHVAPCHETVGQMDTSRPSDQAPRTLKAMACCVACVAAPASAPAALPASSLTTIRIASASANLPVGRRLVPEPGPPRLLIA
ncbi:hypothetical protein [Brevundimonas sp.]|uniref:hypothetical protein n=1 Tax=Brevundimonas sp. TaxID=1871086 RepID=UPI001AC4BC87|nr:hypothetical protein [Brevundimonas sp.]MBN9464233.1 hypothetical protein [Brevundimonas sp.]